MFIKKYLLYFLLFKDDFVFWPPANGLLPVQVSQARFHGDRVWCVHCLSLSSFLQFPVGRSRVFVGLWAGPHLYGPSAFWLVVPCWWILWSDPVQEVDLAAPLTLLEDYRTTGSRFHLHQLKSCDQQKQLTSATFSLVLRWTSVILQSSSYSSFYVLWSFSSCVLLFFILSVICHHLKSSSSPVFFILIGQ